jgi:ATPase subunit of ABC transporter with duplicated ATPase domains
MGYVDVAGVGFVLPDGRELLADVSFRVGEGAKVALVGPNGAGKTTLLRMVAGDLPVQSGTVARAGGLGVMRQFIGMIGDDRTLEDLALSLVEPALQAAGGRLATAAAELDDTEKSQLAYANALAHWGEAGGVRRRGAVRHGVGGDPGHALGREPAPSGPDALRRPAEAVRAGPAVTRLG